MRANNAPINGPILLEKAIQLSVSLESNYMPNASWIERFKQKKNICFTRIHGEKQSADVNAANRWIGNVVPQLLSTFNDDEVYNADETALFYRALPTGTLHIKGTHSFGFKSDKTRITCLFIVNKSGCDIQVFVIGKFKNQRCFRNKTIPLPYYNKTKAWMTTQLFRDILSKFECKMRNANKRVLLLIDNATCHSIDGMNLEFVTVKFFPPNVTSIFQPLDQGIIRSVKAHYRSQLLRIMVLVLDSGVNVDMFAKNVDLLKSMFMLK